ncbi:MAG: radical SAM family heme chaperone HemW [Brevinemataceae bacterium]
MITRTYLHYPFCSTMCHYCNFTAGVSPKAELMNHYFKALIKEINYYKERFDFSTITKDSLYIGGGTPSLMPIEHLENILNQFTISSGTEITLEINPETVTKEKASLWKQLGINRVSLGWQSMNSQILTFLGRSGSEIHNIQAFEILRNTGFDNISVDRILSVTGDTDKDFFSALLEYTPDHISTYQLSIENQTVLKYWTQTNKYLPVPDEKALEIEQQTEKFLSSIGFERYETSNYHRNNKLGSHNLGYWSYDYWLGLGAGASGFLPGLEAGLRYQNHNVFKHYLDNPCSPLETETISFPMAVREALMLGIRKRNGINKQAFEQKLNIQWKQIFNKPCSPEFFEESDHALILKHHMIPFTNPAILSLWNNLVFDYQAFINI